MKKELRY